MSGRKRLNEVIRQENLVVDLLLKHKGADNSITAKEIVTYLAQNKIDIQVRSINHFITRLKNTRRLPICYIRGKGYFVATKRAEVEHTIEDMRKMQKALQDNIDLMLSFILD